MRRPIQLAFFLPMILAIAAPAAGSQPALAPVADARLLELYPGRIEVRLDADFNDDGHVDVAAVMRDDERESRHLVVALGYRTDASSGHEPIDGLAMDPHPLGDAVLSFRKGVLIVEDLTGGTSAIASTYRFRYDGEEHMMRLIGDDVQYYSRTNAHDIVRISTNRLAGLRIRSVDRLTDAGGYAPEPEVRERVDTYPIFMGTAPDPAVTLGLGGEE